MSKPIATSDPIDEAIEGSFPASDPPGWTGMHAGAPVSVAGPLPSDYPRLSDDELASLTAKKK